MAVEGFVVRPGEMTPFDVEGVPGCVALSITRAGRDALERTTIEINTYEPGGGHTPNAHSDAEQIYYVIAGVMRAMVGEQEYIVNAGEFVGIPRNTYHWHENAGDGQMTYMLINTELDE